MPLYNVHYFNVALCDAALFWHLTNLMFNYLMFHYLMLHCIKVALGCPYLMLNIPLFYMVLIAVGIVAAAPFNIVLLDVTFF